MIGVVIISIQQLNSKIVFAVLVMLLCFPILSQDSGPLLIFSGSNHVSGQYSNYQGINSAIPSKYLRNDLKFKIGNPDLFFNGRLYLTSERNLQRQKVDIFRISLAQNWRKKALKSGKNIGFLSKLLSSFEKIELGTCYPNYSKLIIV